MIMTMKTGGNSFKVKKFDDGLSIFEDEAFLYIEKRMYSMGFLIKDDRKTRLSRL